MGIRTVGGSARHWRDRRALASLLRLAVYVVPILASMGAGLLVGHLLRPNAPVGIVLEVAWCLPVLAAAVGALLVTEWLARRLLPLAVLLELSLLFPERAPSRFQVALRSGSLRNLPERLADAQRAGAVDDPTRAAETILSLVACLGAHHRASRRHSERVRAYTELLAEELDLSDRDRHRLRWAALLHDVGKIHVDVALLDNPGPLDDAGWDVLRRHPTEGSKLLAPLWDWLGPFAPTVEQHHERWDGEGYPHRLKGDEICLGARMVAVADTFETMTSGRSYQKPVNQQAARERLTQLAGTQFDPAMVRAFMAISLARLRWAMGPLGVLGESPVLAALLRAPAAALAGTVHVATAGAALAATAATVGIATPHAAHGPAVVPAAGRAPGAHASRHTGSPAPAGSGQGDQASPTTSTTGSGSGGQGGAGASGAGVADDLDLPSGATATAASTTTSTTNLLTPLVTVTGTSTTSVTTTTVPAPTVGVPPVTAPSVSVPTGTTPPPVTPPVKVPPSSAPPSTTLPTP